MLYVTGRVFTSIVDEKTGRPTPITELCEAGAPLDNFCTECEVIVVVLY